MVAIKIITATMIAVLGIKVVVVVMTVFHKCNSIQNDSAYPNNVYLAHVFLMCRLSLELSYS